jgi:hypothetical protein
MTTTGNPYGPDRPCRRITCLHNDQIPSPGGAAAHLGGAHLNPRDRAHYDGPATIVSAMPAPIREAVLPLLSHIGSYAARPAEADTPLRAIAEVAVDVCCREIDRLRQQIATVRADADRQIREANNQAIDCEHHSMIIAEQDLTYGLLSRNLDRTEKDRQVLLAGHQTITDLLDTILGMPRSERASAADALTALLAANAATTRAHYRAWNAR